jgi:hypothetical protein
MTSRISSFAITALLGCVLTAPPAHALWPASGLPLATGPTQQLRPTGIMAPGGQLFAFWIDIGGSYALLAQRVTPEGALGLGWPVGGRGVVSLPAAVSKPEVVSDGAGGALIAWYDFRATGGPHGIYAIRVNAEGAVVAGWNPSGTPICTFTNAQGLGPMNDLVRVSSDGAGGAFVAWTDSRNTPPMTTIVYDVFAHHVLADGTLDPAWPFTGLALTTGTGYKYPHDLIADAAGGFWLVSEKSLETSRIAVTHHAADGGSRGAWATPSYASRPDAVSDGSDGVYVTWDGCHGCTSQAIVDGIYAMRLLPGAVTAPGWTPGGVPVVVSEHDESQPVITATSDGAAVVAWLTTAGSEFEWYAARRIEPSGVPHASWSAEGTRFAITTDVFSGGPLIASDGAGGAMFAFRRNWPNLFGSRVTKFGEIPPAFPDTGLSLCPLSGEQFLATFVSDGLNGAYVLWEDRRDDPPNQFDVYVQRFTRDGEVGSGDTASSPPDRPQVNMTRPFPNPTTGSVGFNLSLATPAHVRVDVLDLSGRVVALAWEGVLPAGSMYLAWNGTADEIGRPRGIGRVRSGVYLVRVRVEGAPAIVKRLVILE